LNYHAANRDIELERAAGGGGNRERERDTTEDDVVRWQSESQVEEGRLGNYTRPADNENAATCDVGISLLSVPCVNFPAAPMYVAPALLTAVRTNE
jgi:hypothetical protein